MDIFNKIEKEMPEVVSVRYVKQNTFMNNSFGKAERRDYDNNGELVNTSKYMSNTAPKAMAVRRIPFDYSERRFKTGNLTQEELNSLVESIGLTYKRGSREGELITKANPRNVADPFFVHEDLTISFESGLADLRKSPKDYLFYKWMEEDKRFSFASEQEGDLRNARTEYLVYKSGELEKKSAKKNLEVMDAVGKLSKMDFDTQKKVLRAMGVEVADPDPDVLKSTLYEMITDGKDAKVYRGAQRNIESFMKYAEASQEELSVRGYFEESLLKGIIYRKSGNRYHYGDIHLGNNKDEATKFLENDAQILEEVIKLCDE